jgi:peptidyl-tRNA hydrolase, PTH1 family
MDLIVGLGNPGERYRRTRHNVGFMVVDALAARAKVRTGRLLGQAWVVEAKLGGRAVMLVKPLAFMNRSGEAVRALMARAKADVAPVVVVDDAALPLGCLRIREGGSDGGHNGLRSMIDALGSEEFPRVRVGIGRSETVADMADYVLSEFPPEDAAAVQEVVGWTAEAVECLVREGIAAAMNRYNGLRRA